MELSRLTMVLDNNVLGDDHDGEEEGDNSRVVQGEVVLAGPIGRRSASVAQWVELSPH